MLHLIFGASNALIFERQIWKIWITWAALHIETFPIEFGAFWHRSRSFRKLEGIHWAYVGWVGGAGDKKHISQEMLHVFRLHCLQCRQWNEIENYHNLAILHFFCQTKDSQTLLLECLVILQSITKLFSYFASVIKHLWLWDQNLSINSTFEYLKLCNLCQIFNTHASSEATIATIFAVDL